MCVSYRIQVAGSVLHSGGGSENVKTSILKYAFSMFHRLIAKGMVENSHHLSGCAHSPDLPYSVYKHTDCLLHALALPLLEALAPECPSSVLSATVELTR